MSDIYVGIGGDTSELNKALDTATREVDNFAKTSGKAFESGAKSSEKLTTGFTKSSKAVQILDGKTGGLASELINVGKASKLAGKEMKAALLASGIGIALIIVSEIAANWDEISGFITGANAELERQKRLNDDINRQIERQKFLRELNEGIISFETQEAVLRAKIAGKSAAEILRIKKKGSENLLAEAQRQVDESNAILKKGAFADEKEYEDAIKNQENAYKRLTKARRALAIQDLQGQLELQKLANKNAQKEIVTQNNWVLNAFKKTSEDLLPITQNISKIIADTFTIPRTVVDESRIRLGEMQLLFEEFNQNAGDLIQGSIADTFGQLGDAIGEALATGGNVLQAIGASLLTGLGNFLSDFGKLMIQYGVAALAYSVASKALLNPLTAAPAAAGLIAAGTLLSIAGSAITSALNGGSSASSSASGAGGSGTPSTYGSRTSVSSSGGLNGGTVVFEIAGTKLVGVLSNTLSRNRSLGGSLSLT